MATKKKKRKNSKAARRRRARRNRRIAICCVLVVLIAAAAWLLLRIMNNQTDKVQSASIITEEESLDVETPVSLSEFLDEEENHYESEIVEEATEIPTAEPTEVPTEAPTAEPTATPYTGPTPEPTRPPVYITITATGDVTLGSGGQKNIRNFPKYFEQYGAEYFFVNVKDYFAEDDITIVNLEGPLTSSTKKRPGRVFNFRGEPEYVNILKNGSVELCNIANNHLMDYKETGAQETISILKENGIGVSGGIDNNEIEYYTEINGYTVGSVGFTEWNFKKEFILNTVKAAAEKCDLLIVSMHWNEEGKKQLSSYCMKMGQALIDSGADIVIGNHTHSLGEIYKYNGKYIINSLGNFCFGGNDILWNYETDVFRQRFLLTDDGTVTDAGIDLKPALNYSTMERRKNNFQPAWPDDALGVEILKTVAGYSKQLDMSQVYWLPDSYVAQHSLESQFGGTVLQEMSAGEAAASRTTAVNNQIETVEG